VKSSKKWWFGPPICRGIRYPRFRTCVFKWHLLPRTLLVSGGERVFAAGANVYPANRISSTIRIFFRISDMGCEPTLGSPSSSVPLHFFLHCPLRPPYHTPPLLFPSLRSSPLKSNNWHGRAM